jgi:inhibitor of cysteine peptidase
MKKAFFLILLAALFVSACTTAPSSKYFDSGELTKFDSKQEIIDFLGQGSQTQDMYYSGTRIMAMDTAAGAPMAESLKAGSDGASEYSTTNIQVDGVDEADFIKNDGKYIYVITGSKLVIVDAYPAEDAEILSETRLEGVPSELFINNNKLVVFTQGYEEVYAFNQYDVIPRPTYKQKTHAIIYDISDRAKPRLVKDYDIKGYYQSSRMIGDYVYFVAQDYVYHYRTFVDTPVIMESGRAIIEPDIYHFDMVEDSYNFNTVVSFNIHDDEINAETFMMGYSNTIYVSENNIYIAYQKSIPFRYYQDYSEDRFYDIVLPLLPGDARSRISGIRNDESLTSAEKWDKITVVLEEMYNSMSRKEKEDFMERIEKAIYEHEIAQEEERRKTIIHKIEIDEGTLTYKAKGEVKGYLLNQFSMDESGEYFRVATTMQTWSRARTNLYNNVYVLDSSLNVVGSLENIALEERIYSARFMGDRLYMVTFKQIDPFFVIDLSNPRAPEILGELKIPGYSDYLHPYDENHVIGVGKETKESEWGGVTALGVKLALFDVSDVANPKQVDKYEIGGQGTDSEALRDHKAFLFDRSRNLLVIPITTTEQLDPWISRSPKAWQGAYVFTLSADGFDLKGKISHGETMDSYWYYGSPRAVRRSLYMDDVLYTISNSQIMMNEIDSLHEISTIKLPYENVNPWGYPYYDGPDSVEPSLPVKEILR